MTPFFLRLRWRIILILAALRQGWPFTKRARAFWRNGKAFDETMMRAYAEIDRAWLEKTRKALQGH